MEVKTVTTLWTVSVEELEALASHVNPARLQQLITGAVSNGSEPKVKVLPAPIPYRRKLPSASNAHMVRCRKCGTEISQSYLVRHWETKSCKANQPKYRAMLRELRERGLEGVE